MENWKVPSIVQRNKFSVSGIRAVEHNAKQTSINKPPHRVGRNIFLAIMTDTVDDDYIEFKSCAILSDLSTNESDSIKGNALVLGASPAVDDLFMCMLITCADNNQYKYIVMPAVGSTIIYGKVVAPGVAAPVEGWNAVTLDPCNRAGTDNGNDNITAYVLGGSNVVPNLDTGEVVGYMIDSEGTAIITNYKPDWYYGDDS